MPRFRNITVKIDVLFVLCYWLIYVIYIAIGYKILNSISGVQQDPYIDEIFHIPQAEDYCNYKFFKWNSKISTPPGLYLLSVAALKILSQLVSVDLCIVYGFRLFNVIIMYFNFHLVYAILKILNPRRLNSSAREKLIDLMTTININIFPILYFYCFFYYTDVLSTYLVLLAYYFHLVHYNRISALIGMLSVTVRQTNIAWLLLFAFANCCNKFNKLSRNTDTPINEKTTMHLQYFTEAANCLYYKMFNVYGKYAIIKILDESQWFIAVAALFIAFVIWNGSLAFGDKDAHTAVIHIPQLFYFSLFCSIFCLQYFLPKLLVLVVRKKHASKSVVLVACLMIFIVKYNSLVHIYLLSDNRHYMFYIWKNCLRLPSFRYMFIPAYILSTYCMIANTRHVPVYYRLGYFIAVLLSLVPQKLLELRYFILPYIFFRLHVRPRYWSQLIFEFSLFAIINYLTINRFIYKPFIWVDDTIQRFSW